MQSNTSPAAEERLRTFPRFHPLGRQEWIAVIAMWLLLTLYSISYSYARGKLSIPIGWDDSTYFVDAYYRLQQFYEHGLPGVAKGYILDTPHAPISTLLAGVGFVLFGVNDVAPYLLNSLIALVFLIYTLKFFRTSIPWFRWVALAYVCSLPLTPMGIVEFRPDFAACLFLALGILTTISEPFIAARPIHLAAGGAFFGLSIFSKPTFFPFALFIWGCSVAAAVLTDFFSSQERKNMRASARSTGIHGGALVAVALLDLAFGWRDIVGYIRMVLFSDKTKVYTATTQGNLQYKALYYLTGEGGKQMLGAHLVVLLAFIAFALFFILQRNREAKLRWASLLALTFISYVFFSLNPAKTPFWGLPFQILMVFAALAGLELFLDWIAKKGLPRAAPYATGALLALPGLFFLQPLYPIRGIRGTPRTDFLWDSHTRIVSVIASQRELAPEVVYISASGDVNNDSLKWMADKQGVTTSYNSESMSDSLDTNLKAMRAADVIVAPEPGIPSIVYSFLPSAHIAGEVLRAAQNDPNFVPADRIPTPDGRYFYIFTNHPYRGWRTKDGMSQVIAPNPATRMPRIRWAYGGDTQLFPEGILPGPVTISGSGLSNVPDQKMIVRVGEQVLGTVDFPELHKFVDFTFSAELKEPSQPVVLSYSAWDHANPKRPVSVLFQRLTIKNTPKKADAGGKE